MVLGSASCATQERERFDVVDTKPGLITDKTEYASNAEWKRDFSSGAPVGWTSGNFIMDGVLIYLHSSMYGTTTSAFRPGSTYAYLIKISDQEQIRVLSKYPGFGLNECVKVLFGESEVRIAPGDRCPE
jgi:hypothetical protein